MPNSNGTHESIKKLFRFARNHQHCVELVLEMEATENESNNIVAGPILDSLFRIHVSQSSIHPRFWFVHNDTKIQPFVVDGEVKCNSSFLLGVLISKLGIQIANISSKYRAQKSEPRENQQLEL